MITGQLALAFGTPDLAARGGRIWATDGTPLKPERIGELADAADFVTRKVCRGISSGTAPGSTH